MRQVRHASIVAPDLQSRPESSACFAAAAQLEEKKTQHQTTSYYLCCKDRVSPSIASPQVAISAQNGFRTYLWRWLGCEKMPKFSLSSGARSLGDKIEWRAGWLQAQRTKDMDISSPSAITSVCHGSPRRVTWGGYSRVLEWS